jgi:hypothetical protein
MVGENFENYLFEVPKMHLQSSTTVGEIFENLFLPSFSKISLHRWWWWWWWWWWW